ncbi:MAG: GEVED domain-containing protein [Alloprevotella sp.]|nr:GEVED domain-containing protein [Alloprevotella sp.]
MKKHLRLFLALCALWLALPGMRAGNGLVLTFNHDGTNIAVNVADSAGQALDGVTATATCSEAIKAVGGSITSGIVCPNVNGSSSPTINITVTVSGLTTPVVYNNIGLDIHALNASGAYQSNSDGKARQFNVAIATGATADATTAFANLTDIDIAAGVGAAGAVHKVWDATSTGLNTADGSLVINLTITKGTSNMGCFFGLSSISLTNQSASGEGGEGGGNEGGDDTPEFPNPSAYYHIKWFGNTSLYITEETDGALDVQTADVTRRQYWQFEPSATAGLYHIKNAVTGHYIGSCNKTPSSASRIAISVQGVPYYIECAASGTVAGYYRLTSSDCANYADVSKSPVGLNKDGASSNIIAWNAGLTNTGSYWQITATPFNYELQPFSYSSAVGTPQFIYTLKNRAGKALTQAADGSLSFETPQMNAEQTWYFVGQTGSGTGFLLVNAASHQPLAVTGETDTRWTVFSGEGTTYYFRPFATRTESATTLTVAGDSLFNIVAARSTYARAAQIYNMPCGSVGTLYVKRAVISGTDIVKGMTYPLPTLSGSDITATEASTPASAYTIYTKDKASVVAGNDFTLSLKLSQAPAEGDTVYAHFDWDCDGVFETLQVLNATQQSEHTVSVPADAKVGKTRARLRLTSLGNEDPEGEVYGQILDFVLQVEAAQSVSASLSVVSNDSTRGTATIVSQSDTEATVQATPLGNATFVCWRRGNVVVSTSADYTLTLSGKTELTAVFSPNTTAIVGIGNAGLSESGTAIDIQGHERLIIVNGGSPKGQIAVYDTAGALKASATGCSLSVRHLPRGTYVVRYVTPESGKACKISLK